MAAPGLAMVRISPRAWEAAETAKMPRFYLDLGSTARACDRRDAVDPGRSASCSRSTRECGLMNAEGAEGVFARHVACAAATRAGLDALGFQLFADPAHASETVTARGIPEALDWKAFNSALKARKLVVAGGQAKLTGKCSGSAISAR